MALNEYRPGTALPGVIGRAFDQSSPPWPQPLRVLLAKRLAGSAVAETIPIAVIATVIGWLVAIALQLRATRYQSGPASASRWILAPVAA
jgi:ABC-type phosphate/phosphonate transport system permease subunit